MQHGDYVMSSQLGGIAPHSSLYGSVNDFLTYARIPDL